jgi:D-alanyl-D-alanine carboxypeptidase (penicillin-binding protein 5/6)
VVVVAVAGFQYLRPLPAVATEASVPQAEVVGTAPNLPWPVHGEAALVVEGLGEVGTSGGTTPIPMASTAKMMTALLVLEDHPLALNEQGPTLTVSRADVATYIAERNENESVLPVVAGEQLTEYQLLQGLLLPSASNFANMLAMWDAGAVAPFITRMNARAAALGMSATHYADVAGFSPQTVSIPSDLIRLAETAMQQPVFAEVVSQAQARLPVAGLIHNLDTLLGQAGIIGIKTGHTDQAGGCFVFAADLTIGDQRTRIYGAVMGQPNALAGAFAATSALVNAIRPSLQLRTVVRQGDVLARYSTAWGESGAIVAGRTVSWVLVGGTTISRRVSMPQLPSTLSAGSPAGSLLLAAGTRHAEIPLMTEAAINGPDPGWRLTRGF